MEIEVKQVLHMNGGTDETSYAKTSYIQKDILTYTKSLKEEIIRELYKANPNLTCLYIADLGCSSAELNNLSVVYELIVTVENERRKLIGRQQGGGRPIEYLIALNDLPTNDFNTVFKSLPSFENLLKQNTREDFGSCFVSVVPGSFYGRLFPANSLHFVHSSYSLHWLSQVPRGIEENKGHIYIGRTSSPKVVKAYCEQFQKDFLTFLRYRSKEVVVGGMMVLTMLGRKTNEPYSKESVYAFDLLSLVLNAMAKEGCMEEEKVNKFNLPLYMPSLKELEDLVQKEGSFRLTFGEVFGVNWTSKEFDVYDFTKCMRSVYEPLFVSHFGTSIIEQVFERYHNVLRTSSTTDKINAFINLTISVSRLG